MATPPEPPLEEKDFIHEEYSKDPYPFWIWLAIFTTVVALIWGEKAWYRNEIQSEVSHNPFLQVTNREFSLFLWQFPEYMRANVRSKSGYLPAFQYLDKVVPEPDLADHYVAAPPKVIFLYQTWNRLLSEEFSQRPIPINQFREFIAYDDEWLPQFWAEAPADYKALIKDLSENKLKIEDLQSLPETSLPQPVRRAFQGWLNYFKEGDQINKVEPTYAQMQAFLKEQPHYARNYWRNIVMDTTPNYLQKFTFGALDPAAIIPAEELAPFLKVAYFNFRSWKSEVGSQKSEALRDIKP